MNGVHDIGGSSGFGPVTDHSKAEPTFHDPWEGRAFGGAVGLTNAGRYEWREFNSIFIEHISRAEQSCDSSTFYQRWPAALEELAQKKGLVSIGELGQHN
ncbi:MAG: nitrile hydratase accessory protein [Dehalococcoidia bacterium]|nr:nitrile hydratase accessory protein [Dehalococcoidia bacterium]